MTYKNILLMAGCALYAAAQAQVTIDIDAQQRGPKVSPMLYGIFYEDINHAADGGIYAELIRNRSCTSRYAGMVNLCSSPVATHGKTHTTHEKDTTA